MKKIFVLSMLAFLTASGAQVQAAAPGKKHPAPAKHAHKHVGHPYRSHEDYCTDREEENGCSTNDSLGLGGIMPIGIYCECGY